MHYALNPYGYDTGTSWSWLQAWWKPKILNIWKPENIHAGNFDGDGDDDLLCDKTDNNYIWITENNNEQFVGRSW